MSMATIAVERSSICGRNGTSCRNCGSALVGPTISLAIGGRIIPMRPLTAVGLASPIPTTSGNLAHGCNMISGKLLLPWGIGMLVGLGYLAWGVGSGVSQGRTLPAAGHRYGPTAPGGYYIRVEPRAVTMSQNQNPQVTVAVENTA